MPETLPAEADQVTAVFELPETVAFNCSVDPAGIDAAEGLTLTATVPGGGVPAETTVTVAEADLLVSAALVATTV